MFLTLVGEEVSGEVLPWAVRDVLRYLHLSHLTCLVQGSYVASVDIINYSCTNIWPVDCCCSYELHSLTPWWLLWRSARVLSYNSGGMHTLLPVTNRPSSIKGLYLILQKFQAILGTWCWQSGHPLRVKQ